MQDISLNIDFTLKIENNDLVIAESTVQNQHLIVKTYKGEWKEKPVAGVGYGLFIEGKDIEALCREIKHQFIDDRMSNVSIKIENNNLIADGTYNRTN